MNVQLLIDTASWILLLSGSAFVFLGGLGLLRMPDLYTRMHAASLTDTLGSLFILLGIMLQMDWTSSLAKLVAVIGFLLVTNPTATYALANAALLAGEKPRTAPAPEKP